ncbi:ATP-binding protein [Streptomyces sp. 8N706]|uniref:ATP-binding protein n=1 Tax=Streptomyces sp. 8N706 TaxID=3457416 RepID=UPI003FD2F2B4
MATGKREKRAPGRRPKEITGKGPVENLARDLRALLEQQDPPVTHGGLARLSGCATGTVSKALAGNVLPTENILRALVVALGEDPSGWLERRAQAAELLRQLPGAVVADSGQLEGDHAAKSANALDTGDSWKEGDTLSTGRLLEPAEPETKRRSWGDCRWRPPAGHLIGRANEARQVRELLARALTRRSGILVIRGQPGIGKTSLLAEAGSLWGSRLLAFRCVESEAELAFAALNGVLRPLTHLVPHLSQPRSRALSVSLALSEPDPGESAPSRVVIGLGTLDLLAKAAPVLVLLDDVQWMDEASAAALSYAVRQLPEAGVAVIIGLRTGGDCPMDLTGHSVMELTTLSRESVRELASTVRGDTIDTDELERLVRHTGGNPLALVELSKSELPVGGASQTEAPLRLPQVLEAAYRKRLKLLPELAQWALLVCAANYTTDLGQITAALGFTGVAHLEPAESAELIALTPQGVEFAHPVIRSVVYHHASAARRRDAHALLARSLPLNNPFDADQRAWHLADATLGPNEQVAHALADRAVQARQRGGLGAAHAAYLRAARLTPSAVARGRRLLAAATCAHLAGLPDKALPLLSEARRLVVDSELLGEIEQVYQQIQQVRATPHEVFAQLSEAAASLSDSAPITAANLLATAASAGAMGGPVPTALAAATKGHQLAQRVKESGTLATTVLRAHTLLLDGQTEPASVLLHQRFDQLLNTDPLIHGAEVFGFACTDLTWLDEHTAARRLIDHGLRHIRSANALERVPILTSVLADLEFRQGRWKEAHAAAAECLALADKLRQPALLGYSASTLAQIQAAQGEPERCRDYASQALSYLEPGGYDLVAPYAHLALAQLCLNQGEHLAAATRFVTLHERIESLGVRNPAVYPFHADMVEACLLSHWQEAAVSVLVLLTNNIGPSAPAAVRAALARSRGLLAKDANSALRHFTTALDLYSRASDRYGLARTRLALGQRLRRAGHQDPAQRQFKASLSLFQELNATQWIQRVNKEMRICG